MRIFVAFVIVCQSFGSPYMVAEDNTWRLSQLSMIQPQPFPFFQNTLPYQKSRPYHHFPHGQQYNWLNQEYENYEIRSINRRQSALFSMLKCLIESNIGEYCRMMMHHLKLLFEPEQTPPIRISQPIVIKIINYDQSERNQKPLSSKPEEATSSVPSIEKFPENDTNSGRNPSMISNTTEVSNFTSENNTKVSVKDSTTETSTPSEISNNDTGAKDKNDKDKETIAETATDTLDTLMLEENTENNSFKE